MGGVDTSEKRGVEKEKSREAEGATAHDPSRIPREGKKSQQMEEKTITFLGQNRAPRSELPNRKSKTRGKRGERPLKKNSFPKKKKGCNGRSQNTNQCEGDENKRKSKKGGKPPEKRKKKKASEEPNYSKKKDEDQGPPRIK